MVYQAQNTLCKKDQHAGYNQSILKGGKHLLINLCVNEGKRETKEHILGN